MKEGVKAGGWGGGGQWAKRVGGERQIKKQEVDS